MCKPSYFKDQVFKKTSQFSLISLAIYQVGSVASVLLTYFVLVRPPLLPEDTHPFYASSYDLILTVLHMFTVFDKRVNCAHTELVWAISSSQVDVHFPSRNAFLGRSFIFGEAR